MGMTMKFLLKSCQKPYNYSKKKNVFEIFLGSVH